MKDIENHIVVDDLWKEEKPRRCKRCGRTLEDCTCDYID